MKEMDEQLELDLMNNASMQTEFDINIPVGRFPYVKHYKGYPKHLAH